MSIILMKLGDNSVDKGSLVQSDGTGLTITDDTYSESEFNVTKVRDSPLGL